MRFIKNRRFIRVTLRGSGRRVRRFLRDERTLYQLKNAEFTFYQRSDGGQTKYVRTRFYVFEYRRYRAVYRQLFLVWEIFTRNGVSRHLHSGTWARERGYRMVAEKARNAYF